MLYDRHRTLERRARRYAWLLVAIVVAIAVFMIATGAADNPVKVLGCTWDRARADVTATTSEECRP